MEIKDSESSNEITLDETKDTLEARDKNDPHPRLPQYTIDEVERSIEVIQMLIKVRDRCRKQGLINW